jgi:ATP/maltotriose-dependent transcriptional regulator MalT
MANKVQSKCLCCGDIFTVDVRNRGRQKYCPKGACRAAGKAARQRRWLAKPENRNYFREADNAARVREWQHTHPGYWRNTARYRRRTLQDAHRVQVADLLAESASVALQDALRCQGPVLIGLIAHLSDSTLQDDIAQTSRRLLQLGQDILSGKVSDARQTGAAP